jgi:hypothetical protein
MAYACLGLVAGAAGLSDGRGAADQLSGVDTATSHECDCAGRHLPPAQAAPGFDPPPLHMPPSPVIFSQSVPSAPIVVCAEGFPPKPATLLVMHFCLVRDSLYPSITTALIDV